jgi:hypothetical protein
VVISFLCWEHSESEEALFKWFASLQVADSWSVFCTVATTTEKISTSSLCWLSHVVHWFYQLHEYILSLHVFALQSTFWSFLLSGIQPVVLSLQLELHVRRSICFMDVHNRESKGGEEFCFCEALMHRYIIYIHIYKFLCESDVRCEHDLPACKEHPFATMPWAGHFTA